MELFVKLLIAYQRPMFVVLLTTSIGFFCGSALTGFFVGALIVSLVNLFL